MSGDHYEMIGKVAFGVSRPGGGCTGSVGVNIAWWHRGGSKKGEIFGPSPPSKKCLRGVGAKDFTWAPPMMASNGALLTGIPALWGRLWRLTSTWRGIQVEWREG